MASSSKLPEGQCIGQAQRGEGTSPRSLRQQKSQLGLIQVHWAMAKPQLKAETTKLKSKKKTVNKHRNANDSLPTTGSGPGAKGAFHKLLLVLFMWLVQTVDAWPQNPHFGV